MRLEDPITWCWFTCNRPCFARVSCIHHLQSCVHIYNVSKVLTAKWLQAICLVLYCNVITSSILRFTIKCLFAANLLLTAGFSTLMHVITFTIWWMRWRNLHQWRRCHTGISTMFERCNNFCSLFACLFIYLFVC